MVKKTNSHHTIPSSGGKKASCALRAQERYRTGWRGDQCRQLSRHPAAPPLLATGLSAHRLSQLRPAEQRHLLQVPGQSADVVQLRV